MLTPRGINRLKDFHELSWSVESGLLGDVVATKIVRTQELSLFGTFDWTLAIKFDQKHTFAYSPHASMNLTLLINSSDKALGLDSLYIASLPSFLRLHLVC